MRILELAAPITPEGVDGAGHAIMRRLEDLVTASPADAELAARAQAYACEVRAAHAFLRERPPHLYPYRMVEPSGEQPSQPAPGTGLPPGAFQPLALDPLAPPTEMEQAGGKTDPPHAALPSWGNPAPARSTPPPLPNYYACSATSPAQSSRRSSGLQTLIAVAALVIACGASLWYGVQHFYPADRWAPGAGGGLSSNQPESAPGEGGKPAAKYPSKSDAAGLRGASSHEERPGDGSPRRLEVKIAPDGSTVATLPDGSTFHQRPGGNRYGTYGPKGSPFGNHSSSGRTWRMPSAGASLSRKSPDQGDAEADYNRATKLLFPPSPPSDAPEGLRLLEKAASQNHLMASYMLACTYLDGIGRPADPKKGVSMLKSLTDGRDFPVAALRLADCHRDELGVPCDYEFALSVYQHWQTLPAAQYRLSLMYQFGCGVDKDDDEALKWLQLAVAASHSPALYQMGLRYAKGLGVPQDDDKAVQVYEQAAKLGYAPALAALGRCYHRARGVPFEGGLAIHYYQQAAVQGFPHAQDYLGSCYAEGECIWKDPVQAAGWYAKAAAQGHGPAQMHLGNLLMEDHPKLAADPVRALAWFIRAESEDVEGAAEKVRETKMLLSSQDIAAAERAAASLPRTSPWNQWQPFSP